MQIDTSMTGDALMGHHANNAMQIQTLTQLLEVEDCELQGAPQHLSDLSRSH